MAAPVLEGTRDNTFLFVIAARVHLRSCQFRTYDRLRYFCMTDQYVKMSRTFSRPHVSKLDSVKSTSSPVRFAQWVKYME